MKTMAETKTFAVQSMAINFLMTHRAAYYAIAEQNGKYIVLPKSK